MLVRDQIYRLFATLKPYSSQTMELTQLKSHLGIHDYIPRRKSGIYWIQVRRAAAAAAVEISLWTR